MIPKKHNHDHYWIEDEILYESYNTIRGMRHLYVSDVPGMPDIEKCNEAELRYIDLEYFNS